jgi:hypothetical protein
MLVGGGKNDHVAAWVTMGGAFVVRRPHEWMAPGEREACSDEAGQLR